MSALWIWFYQYFFETLLVSTLPHRLIQIQSRRFWKTLSRLRWRMRATDPQQRKRAEAKEELVRCRGSNHVMSYSEKTAL